MDEPGAEMPVAIAPSEPEESTQALLMKSMDKSLKIKKVNPEPIGEPEAPQKKVRAMQAEVDGATEKHKKVTFVVNQKSACDAAEAHMNAAMAALQRMRAAHNANAVAMQDKILRALRLLRAFTLPERPSGAWPCLIPPQA